MIPKYWHNWVRNQEAVAHYYTPRSVDELQTQVAAAATRGRVRTVGRSYAWSPLIPTQDSLIDMRHCNRLLGSTAGPTPTITVEAGISMRDLTTRAARLGLTLKSPTIFPRVSIGGVIATGSHGTGSKVQTFSDAATALTFVRPDGNLETITRTDARWPAAAVGLGCFGPLYSVTLAAEPAFNVRVEQKKFSIPTMLSGIVDAVHSYEFVEMYWFPFDDNMWLMAIERTEEPRDTRSLGDLVRLAGSWALTQLAGYAILPVMSRRAPQLTPAVMKVAPSFQFREGVTVEASACEFHYVTAYPMNYDMEYALPLERAAEAWQVGMDLVLEYGGRGRYPVNFVLHARYIKASDALLSPAHASSGLMCMIEAVTAIGTPGRDEFYARLATAWANLGGRPHWGKMLYHPERLAADYGANMAAFESVRDTYDHNRVFLNPFLEHKVLQLAP